MKNFNTWLYEIFSKSIVLMNKSDSEHYIKRYAQYRVNRKNNIPISRIERSKIDTLLSFCIHTIISNQNIELFELIVEGVNNFQDEINGGFSIEEKEGDLFILKVGKHSVFLFESKQNAYTVLDIFLMMDKDYKSRS